MTTGLEGFVSKLQSGALTLVSLLGLSSLPGCPVTQTPRAATTTTDTTTTVDTTTVREDLLSVTQQVRPVTVPPTEDDTPLLP